MKEPWKQRDALHQPITRGLGSRNAACWFMDRVSGGLRKQRLDNSAFHLELSFAKICYACTLILRIRVSHAGQQLTWHQHNTCSETHRWYMMPVAFNALLWLTWRLQHHGGSAFRMDCRILGRTNIGEQHVAERNSSNELHFHPRTKWTLALINSRKSKYEKGFRKTWPHDVRNCV